MRPALWLNNGTTACKWDVVIPFNKYVQIGEKVIYEQEYVFDKMKSGVSYREALEDFLSKKCATGARGCKAL